MRVPVIEPDMLIAFVNSLDKLHKVEDGIITSSDKGYEKMDELELLSPLKLV